jgi:hypothetical protein
MSFFDAANTGDVTLHGLEKWTCHMYEQLGWMTLANESGREDKVSSYITSIKKLKNSIESRLKIVISEDAKLDLTNLLSKVKHLLNITTKLFNKEHIRKTICNKCALPVNSDESESDINSSDNEQKTKQIGGSKSKSKIKSKTKSKTKSNPKSLNVAKSKMSKSTHLNELSKLSKKLSKKSSKKSSKKPSKKSSKKQSKILSKILSKKTSKSLPKKTSKKNLKKIQGGAQNDFVPLIKKLSKKSSKKSSKNVFRKI